MQQDFHYYAVKVLARAAGFPDNEAQAIACASQYTDNATESKPLDIDPVPDIANKLVKNGMFDPVCTAHRSINYLKLIFSDANKKKSIYRAIYIPFHFLPAEKYSGEGAYDYRVKTGSKWARELIESATDAVIREKDGIARRMALIRMGLTLHVFADTYAHETFSGRRNEADNHVKKVDVSGENGGGIMRLFRGFKWIFDIGHAEVILVPDMSNLSWSCRHVGADTPHKHDNTEECLNAAKAIYDALCRARGTAPDFDNIRDRLKRCFSTGTLVPEQRRFSVWRILFPQYSLYYDHHEWRQASLVGSGYDWDGMRKASDFAAMKFQPRDDGNIDWFLFHVIALEHRLMVIDNIKADLE